MPNTLQHEYSPNPEVRRRTLQELLARLQHQHDLETRVEEKMRLEHSITNTQAKLQQLDAETDAKMQREIQHTEWASCLIRIQDPAFKAIRTAVMNALRSETGRRHALLTEQLTSLVANPDTVDDFLFWWECRQSQPAEPIFSDEENREVAERIRAGKVVLFLGSDVLGGTAQETALANQLAQLAKYGEFNGSLSAIAEYYRLKFNLGVEKLVDRMGSILPNDPQAVTFYQTLAAQSARLVLISAAYDELEQALRQAVKPFVVLTSIVQRGQYGVGHVQVSFSDTNPEAGIYTKEETSGLDLKRYSIIYKIRGTCRTAQGENTPMTLTESDYFSFARLCGNHDSQLFGKPVAGFRAAVYRLSPASVGRPFAGESLVEKP
ncbi:MAG: hypothetical protein BWK73_53980 [Thiothrix lacustris]|uniref:Uncharacterized protein n=1 Tax=Thiothrix lacustris TaxID=525917 RepID=A0A1Y1Q6T0_9GAMM|nr:MAG: hypothetical protein BWK73_53980 [Thiothrix lacustris]